MIGRGHAWGAVSILNATATGIGCALAVRADAVAQWTWSGDDLHLTAAPDERVGRAVQLHLGGQGAHASCRTVLPAARGLKTSSSAAAALLQAATAARKESWTNTELMAHAVAVCRKAGVTLTGALDDQAAVVLGGAHLTDNRADRIVQELPVAPWHVAIWLPTHSIPKSRFAQVDASAIAVQAGKAAEFARQGQLPQAMTHNGAAFTQLYRAAGLPIDDAAAQIALHNGALGAGLSGTGPSIAALFERREKLPDVPGGTWLWTTVAEGPA